MANDNSPVLPSKDEIQKKLEEISKENIEFQVRMMTANCYCPAPDTKKDPLPPSPPEPIKRKKTLVSKILHWLKLK